MTSMPSDIPGRPTVHRPWDDPLMDATGLRAWCLGRPGAVEDFPFGPEHSVFKVAGKMFALSALDRTPLEVSVKSEPELAVQLRRSYAAIRPGYHPEQAPQEHDHPRRQPSRPAHSRPHRRLVRPRLRRPAEARAQRPRDGGGDAGTAGRLMFARSLAPDD